MRPILIVMLMLIPLAGTAGAQTTQPMRNDGGSFDQSGRRNWQQRNFDDQRGNYRRNRRGFADAEPMGSFTSSTQPDPEQAEIPTPRDMTGDYLILTVRSIFSRDGSVGGIIRPPGGGEEPRLESVLVFNEATRTDGVFAASLENTSTGQITTVHVGSQIAQGKVISISLDEMDYQPPSAAVMHLAIGQNLAGEQIYGSGAVSTSLPAGVDMSGPNADVLKKMMLRRQQELNGGK